MRCLAYSSRILTGGRTFYGGSNSAGPACNWRSSESVIGSTASSGSTFAPGPTRQRTCGRGHVSCGGLIVLKSFQASSIPTMFTWRVNWGVS